MALFLQQNFPLSKFTILILFSFLIHISPVHSQSAQVDSSHSTKVDSTAVVSSQKKNTELTHRIIKSHPYFRIYETPQPPPYSRKINNPGKEIYFYTIIVVLLLFSILKASFDKYFTDLMKLFFRRSLKQRQLKQQVLQNALPSLLFNIIFVLIGGLFGAIAIKRTTPHLKFDFDELLLFSTTGLGFIYLSKYFILKFIGWAFRVQKLANDYSFVIFLVNKVLGIILIPLLILLLLTDHELNTIAWTLSWIIIGFFILYRYISSIKLVQKESNINSFHFLLYIAAFEILPTIILYKGIAEFLK